MDTENQDTGSLSQDNTISTQDIATEETQGTELSDSKIDSGNSFLDILPDEYKQDKSFTQYTDISSLLKTYKEQERMLGTAVAHIPDENSTPEQWNKFYNKIGRPETCNEYAVSEKELPEDYQRDEEFIKEYAQKAHELGLTKKQFHDLYHWVEEKNLVRHQQFKDDLEKTRNELTQLAKKELGENVQQIVEDVENIISDNLPEEFDLGIQSLDDQSKFALTILMKNIKNKYIAQDTFDNLKTGVSTKDDKRNELLAVREQIKKVDRFSKEYENLANKKRQLYNEIGEGVINWYESPKNTN